MLGACHITGLDRQFAVRASCKLQRWNLHIVPAVHLCDKNELGNKKTQIP